MRHAEMQRRIVFDTGVLVSAAIRPNSTPSLALQKALQHFELCASTETLAELENVLGRPKFDHYLSSMSRQAFIAGMRKHCLLLNVTLVVTDCVDPGDNKFLALAETARAELIVASDPHLCTLHPWRGIPIMPPMAFLKLIA